MPLVALLLALPAFADDRSDATRAETHERSERSDRSDADRAESERADGGRSETRSRSGRGSDAVRVDPRAARAHRSDGVRAYHPRYGRPHGARYVPAHRVHHVHAHSTVVAVAAPPPRERSHAKVRREKDVDHAVSVLVTVIDIPAPLFAASAEVALGRNVGLLGSGGIGFSEYGALYDLGGDVRLYAAGDFDTGVFVGGGAGVTNISPFAMNDRAVTFEAFVGAKHASRIGLTGEVTVGVEAANHADIGGLYPKVTFGLGWSF